MNFFTNLFLDEEKTAAEGTGFNNELLEIIKNISLIFGGLVILYALYLGYMMATASDASKRAEAKNRVLNSIAIILIIVALVGLLSIIEVKITSIPGGETKITSWIKQVPTDGVDMDGKFGKQCVDLIKHYISSMYGVDNVVLGNGKDVWKSDALKDANFKAIAGGGDIKAGDIICFNAAYGGGSASSDIGHVAVVTAYNKETGEITIMDQNHYGGNDTTVNKPENKPAQYTFKLVTSAVTGVARPPGG
jgi:hypothetical protein